MPVRVVAAVEVEPPGEERRLLRPRGVGVARDDLVVPGDGLAVVVGPRQGAGAVEHRLGRARAHLGIDLEQQLAGVEVAAAPLVQRLGQPVVALAAGRVGHAVGDQRELGDRLVPQVGGDQVLGARDVLGGGQGQGASPPSWRSRASACGSSGWSRVVDAERVQGGLLGGSGPGDRDAVPGDADVAVVAGVGACGRAGRSRGRRRRDGRAATRRRRSATARRRRTASRGSRPRAWNARSAAAPSSDRSATWPRSHSA